MNLLIACSYLQDSMFMLIMKEFEYLYCRKLLLLLLLLLLSFLKSQSCSTHTNSYVDALRDVVTSAIYVPMFVGCILVLMVLCKKIVLVVFAKTSLVRTRYLLQFHSSIDPRDHPDVYVFFFKSSCDLSFVLIDFFCRYKRDAEEIIEQEEFQEYSRREKRKTWKEFNPLFGRTNNNNNNNNHGDIGVAEQYGQAAQIEMQPATLHRQQTAMSENFPTIPPNVRSEFVVLILIVIILENICICRVVVVEELQICRLHWSNHQCNRHVIITHLNRHSTKTPPAIKSSIKLFNHG
jgi:hypothetical protein